MKQVYVFQASQVAQLVKNLPVMQDTWVLIPGLGRSPGERKGYPLQYSGLERSLHLQIFSSLLWVAFLFIVFFAVQKLLSLIRSHLFIFVFISVALGGGS